MNRLVSILIAAFAWTAGADEYKFTEVPHEGRGASALRTLYIKGPSVISVDKLSWRAPGNPDAKGSAVVAISPVGSGIANAMDCGPNLEPQVRANNHNISVSGLSSPGSVRSFKMVVKESGAYIVNFVSCSEKSLIVSFTISSPGLGAHEHGWVFQYAFLLLLYTGVSIAWWRNRERLSETPELSTNVSYTCLVFLGMACAGLVLHGLPQKGLIMKAIITALTVCAISMLMTSILWATALGFGGLGRFADVACVLFSLCHTMAFTNSEWTYENVCDDLTCTPRWRQWSVMLPLVGVSVAFCVSCFFCLMQSKRSCQRTGSDYDPKFFQPMAAVVVVYTVLSMVSAMARAYDVPVANNGNWTTHRVANVVAHLTQAFGLMATIWVLRMGVPSCAFSEHTTVHKSPEEADDETPSFIADGNVEKFAIDNVSDDEVGPIKESGDTPVVYGSQK